jgi:hypothetical protein
VSLYLPFPPSECLALKNIKKLKGSPFGIRFIGRLNLVIVLFISQKRPFLPIESAYPRQYNL